jgi:hypothetical protein
MPITIHRAVKTHTEIAQRNKEKLEAELNQMISDFCTYMDEQIVLHIFEITKEPMRFNIDVLLTSEAIQKIQDLYTDFDFAFPYPHSVSVKLKGKQWDWGGYKS